MTTEFLYKAKDNLNVAQWSFDNGYYDACANRAYYAALQAAIAALADNGIKRERMEYKWIQAEFAGKLIKSRKVYPAKLKSYLPEMLAIREKADYKTDKVNKKKAFEQLCMAKEMLDLIEKEIL
jgi:uncharacterized protein (UPF0332 family)